MWADVRVVLQIRLLKYVQSVVHMYIIDRKVVHESPAPSLLPSLVRKLRPSVLGGTAKK